MLVVYSNTTLVKVKFQVKYINNRGIIKFKYNTC